MPFAHHETYAKHLTGTHGYPLWTPQLRTELPYDYQYEGLKIGDVGVVSPLDGSFDVLFNITMPRDSQPDPSLLRGDFVPIRLDEERHIATQNDAFLAHEFIPSPSVELTSQHVNASHDQTPSRAEYEFTLSTENGAVLILPEGAQSRDLRSEKRFLDEAIRHAVDWYEIATGTAGRLIGDDSLYLITGFYKARSWSLGATGQNLKTGRSVKFNVGQIREGGVTAEAYSWEVTHGFKGRVGPMHPYEIGRGVYSKVPNQAVFIRGFRITINKILFLKRVTVESGQRTLFKFIGFGSHLSGGTELGSTPLSEPEAGMDNTVDQDSDSVINRSPLGTGTHITIDHIPEVSRTFHPGDSINQYMLRKKPHAMAAVTHDSFWIEMLRMGLLELTDFSRERHLHKVLSEHYRMITEDGTVYLESGDVSRTAETTTPQARAGHVDSPLSSQSNESTVDGQPHPKSRMLPSGRQSPADIAQTSDTNPYSGPAGKEQVKEETSVDSASQVLSVTGNESDTVSSATPLLSEWAKVALANDSWQNVLLSAVEKLPFSRFTIYQAICECLETTDRTADASESFRQMLDEFAGEENMYDEQAAWVLEFRRRCSSHSNPHHPVVREAPHLKESTRLSDAPDPQEPPFPSSLPPSTPTLLQQLAPPVPEPVSELLERVRRSIHSVVLYLRQFGIPKAAGDEEIVDNLVRAAITAIRDLLYVCGPSFRHFGGKDKADIETNASQTRLVSAQRRAVAALSKFVQTAQAALNDGPRIASDDVSQLSSDAEELERSVVEFVHIAQGVQNQGIAGPKRLHGYLSAPHAGTANAGAGAAGTWQGFGWVDVEDHQEGPRRNLTTAILNEFVDHTTRVRERLSSLTEVLRVTRRADVVITSAQELLKQLSVLVLFLGDIHIARHVDIKTVNESKLSDGTGYMGTVKKGRVLVRLFEAAAQAIYDDGAALLAEAQRIRRVEPCESWRGRETAYDTMETLCSSLDLNLKISRQSLESLVCIGMEQTEILERSRKMPVKYRISQRSLASKTLSDQTPAMASTNSVLFWTNQDPRESQLFDTSGILYRFATVVDNSGQSTTTLWRAVRANREDRVAKLEWASNGGLGRAVIGKNAVPMSDLVRPDSYYPGARIFNAPDGLQYRWRPSSDFPDILLEDPTGTVVAFFRPTRPTRYQIGDVYGELHFLRHAGSGTIIHPPMMDTVAVTAMLYRFCKAFDL